MSCLPITEWVLRKKNCTKIETHQHNRSAKGKCISKKKVKEYVESLPTGDLMERICDLDKSLKTKTVKLKDIHLKMLLGNYLHGCFIDRLDPLK